MLLLKKIANVTNLDSQTRFEYFIRKVADFGTLYGLYDTGWATAKFNEKTIVSLWPEKEFAQLCATSEWGNFSPKEIDINYFLEKWIPGMHADGYEILIFPTPTNGGYPIDPMNLLDKIKLELDQYE